MRRYARIPALLVAIAALASGLGVARPPEPAAAATATAPRPVLFGAVANSLSELSTHERNIGKRLNAARVFRSWNQPVFSADMRTMGARGTDLFVSVKARNRGGGLISFRDIANSKPGSRLYADMVRQADQIKAYRRPVYMIFNHEPEASHSLGSGTGAQFAAAWRKWVWIQRLRGVTNARYVWTMTDWGFVRRDSRNARYYYPGDAWVHYIGADAYNFYNCRSYNGRWISFRETVAGVKAFGARHPSKGIVLPEFSSVEDRRAPGRKAQWFREAAALLQQPEYRQFKAVLQWGGFGKPAPAGCYFDYWTSTAAKRSLVAMAKSPAYSVTYMPR
jgi:hypothetical protein